MSIVMDFIWAFGVGGALCVIAQILIDKTALTPARILVSYVCCGVLLTGLGIYAPLVELAGAGATTPLTGFGYSIATGVKEAVDSQGPIGILTGGLSATSGGITVTMVMALTMALIFKSKQK